VLGGCAGGGLIVTRQQNKSRVSTVQKLLQLLAWIDDLVRAKQLHLHVTEVVDDRGHLLGAGLLQQGHLGPGQVVRRRAAVQDGQLAGQTVRNGAKSGRERANVGQHQAVERRDPGARLPGLSRALVHSGRREGRCRRGLDGQWGPLQAVRL